MKKFIFHSIKMTRNTAYFPLLLLLPFLFSPLYAAHNFSFEFGPDTLLKQLIWSPPSGVSKRIVWDEYTRFNTNGGPGSFSWYNQYFHSPSAADTTVKTGWRYNLNYDALDPSDPGCQNVTNCQERLASVIKTSRSEITYEFQIAPTQTTGNGSLFNDDHLQIYAFSMNPINTSEVAIEVIDDLIFDGNTIHVTMAITNRLSQEIKVLEVPFYFGSLMIGNYDFATRKIINGNTQLSRLRPTLGGHLEQNYTSPNGFFWDNYPSIGVYSPVSALWGEAKFGSDNSLQSGAVTMGGQFLTAVELPNQVAWAQHPYYQHSPALNARIRIRNLQPNQSQTFNFAFTLSEGNNWQQALLTYKNWFNQQYGTLNNATQTFEATPSYCPTGPFEYLVGSNKYGAYNATINRYNRVPNSSGGTDPLSLRDLFNSDQSAPVMRSMGIERFGIWQTALNSQYLASADPTDPTNCLSGRCEFNPNILLIDPNIDASMDNVNLNPNTSVIKDFTDVYTANNMDVLWFSRPCMYLEGANVEYDGGENPPFVPGVPNWSVDLTNSSNRARALAEMEFLVARGVKGFYIDAAGCAGDNQLLQEAKQTFQSNYGIDLFIAKEGVIDRESLLWPQIPVLKLPHYDYTSSLLMNYLVPDGTYYGGSVNEPLLESEFEDILDKGYQAIPSNFPSGRPTTWLCHIIERSYENYHQKWVNYGQSLGCAEPPLIPPACINYPDVRFDVLSTAGPHGSISPSGTVSVMEGSFPTFTIMPDPGYRIKTLLVDNRIISNPRTTYTFNTIYEAGHSIHVEFVLDGNNIAPSVNAGEDQTISLDQFASLNGVATDDGFPSSSLSTLWTQISGPGLVTFGNPSLLSTTARFSLAGPYKLRLTANDGLAESSDDIDILALDPYVNSFRTNDTRFIACANPADRSNSIPICFNVAQSGLVSLRVYTRKGELIRTLKNEDRSAGLDMVLWDGKNEANDPVSSGAYLVVLETSDKRVTSKVVVIR